MSVCVLCICVCFVHVYVSGVVVFYVSMCTNVCGCANTYKGVGMCVGVQMCEYVCMSMCANVL